MIYCTSSFWNAVICWMAHWLSCFGSWNGVPNLNLNTTPQSHKTCKLLHVCQGTFCRWVYILIPVGIGVFSEDSTGNHITFTLLCSASFISDWYLRVSFILWSTGLWLTIRIIIIIIPIFILHLLTYLSHVPYNLKHHNKVSKKGLLKGSVKFVKKSFQFSSSHSESYMSVVMSGGTKAFSIVSSGVSLRDNFDRVLCPMLSCNVKNTACI
jgi:hypothetical protein